MKLANYSPTYRQVLFKIESIATKTAGGIIIPSSDFLLKKQNDFTETEEVQFDASKSNLVKYVVVKTGEDCTKIKINDHIVIMDGIRPQLITLDDERYFQVNEQQIIGYSRESD